MSIFGWLLRSPREQFEQAARAHAESRASKGTRYLYKNDLKKWLRYCDREEIDPTKPAIAHASRFQDELLSRHKPLTVRRTIAALSSMYGATLDLEKPLVTWNPWKRLPRPPADAYTRTESYSVEEAEAIIKAAKGSARDTAILLLMYETGLRRSSVANLKRAGILTRGDITVAHVTVKGGKQREVEIPPRAAFALMTWLASSPAGEYVFPKHDGGAIDPTIINRLVKDYGEAAGVEHAHPHRFRATFVTDALDKGVPLHEVQAAVHHSDPHTTQRYDRGIRGVGVTAAVAKFLRGRGAVMAGTLVVIAFFACNIALAAPGACRLVSGVMNGSIFLAFYLLARDKVQR